MLALGLPAQVLVKALSPAFFAREDTMTPLLATLAGLAVAVLAALSLSSPFGASGIAAAIALGAWSSAVVLIARSALSFGFSLDRDATRRLPFIVLASLAMGGALWLATHLTSPWAAQAHTLLQAVLLGLLIVCGLAIYAAMLTLTGAVRWAELRMASSDHSPPTNADRGRLAMDVARRLWQGTPLGPHSTTGQTGTCYDFHATGFYPTGLFGRPADGQSAPRQLSRRDREFRQTAGDAHCIYCVVDMHAVTVPIAVWGGPDELRRNTREVTAAFIASGIDPKKQIIFNQSQVSGHAELAWIFNCVARLGWLNRMTQFKERPARIARTRPWVSMIIRC